MYYYDQKAVEAVNKLPQQQQQASSAPTAPTEEQPSTSSQHSAKKSSGTVGGGGLGIYVIAANGQKLDVFRNLRQTISDPWEVLFMRAEGIHAHGYHAHACQVRLKGLQP